MARIPRVMFSGKPVTGLKVLEALIEQFGSARGREIYKLALLVERHTWAELAVFVPRRTLLRYRSDLLAAGILRGDYNGTDTAELLDAVSAGKRVKSRRRS